MTNEKSQMSYDKWFFFDVLNLLRKYRRLAPADCLRWWELIVVNDPEMTLGGLHHFARRMTLESE
jgi:hypothetical protein